LAVGAEGSAASSEFGWVVIASISCGGKKWQNEYIYFFTPRKKLHSYKHLSVEQIFDSLMEN